MTTLAEMIHEARNSAEFTRAHYLARVDREFVDALIAVRREQGLSQADVAERMGITQQGVSKFERYDNDPRMSTIRNYANAIGVVIEYSIQDDRRHDENGLNSAPADERVLELT
ncbi:XRE family transcriptional regulator [Mycetocola tolaasinivorans]|uniref:XRE family transcriptional regulator n=1 Tax=Mycetocola tolaasinivorans TaxID=76635 RepID=A0A3L6ZZS3_9MICO|nr:helix-turn-helix transcriptional regulator [Mycetocola tolaasinivorans]RLP73314.1 XRE family transcriptional regulator [Mycetocola tolaasinivorans]